MLLKDIFTKDISRSIDGVVKVGNDTQSVTQIELQEYVVTKEIDKHMRTFFDALHSSETQDVYSTGVWISGFFGSGKSHFLKIMGLLLQNKEIGGKLPIQYFEDKVTDKLFYAEIKKYIESHNCHTVLFNIDAISSHHGSNRKDAIVESCMKAFFQSLGFFHQKLWLADKERRLRKDGLYDDFKKTFQEQNGSSWETARIDIDLEMGAAAKAFMSVKDVEEESAKQWFDGKYQLDSYEISPQDFAEIIKSFCDISGGDMRVFFMIDEVGQYMGSNGGLMLNLQTVTELLGTHTRGKAWTVITSQEAIDSVTNMEGITKQDFSKIKGRFPTQLSLSSSNVDEVIQKRILEKTDEADKELLKIYDKEEQHLRNMFRFDGYESKFYSDRINFSKLYPLVPYQVDLLKESLNAIGNSGYAGSHLSRGERSLLTFFKESIQSYKDESTGKIVSFADLYNALESRIETYIKSTIHSASELPGLPPRALDVLKVLFMLKYVRLVSLTTDNISTLLIQDVHEDMVVLKKQVEEALVFLEKHNYVNKGADAWEFLSNEEQEMERMISGTPIDELDVYAQVHDLVFATNQYGLANKYQHDKYHNVSFKKQIDEYEKVSIDSQLSVKLLRKNENTETDGFSFSAKQIRIVLPDNNIGELRNMISKCKKIEKFILQHNASDKNSDRITQKGREKELLMQKAIELLDDSLKESQIFLGAQELDLSGSSFKDRIHKALHSLFDTVYSEFGVLQKPYKDDDIKELLSRANKVATQEALMEDMSPNLAARDRISNHIIQQGSQSFNVTLKSLQEKFSSAPYGWSDSDISGILTELYLSKIVILKYDGKSIEVEDSRLVEYLTKSTHKERLLVNPKQAIDTRVVRDVSEAMSSLGMTVSNRAQEDQDELFKEILGWRSTTVSQLEGLLQQYGLRSYPGKEKIESFHQLVNGISPYLEQQGLFDSILEQSSSLLEAKNSATMVIQFFDGKQKDIFISGLESVGRYNSISTLLNEDSKSTLQQLSEILQKEEPYSDIPQIKQLVNKLDASYQEILESKRSSTKERADGLVDQLLEIGNLDKDLKANVEDKLDSLLYQPIANTKEIAELMTIHDQLPKMVEQVQSIISSAEKESGNVVASATVNKRTVKLLSLQKMPHSIKTEEDVATFTDNIANQLRKELKDGDTIVII